MHLRGPACHEIAKQNRIPIEPLKRLQIVLLKRVAQAIGKSRLVVCQSTARLLTEIGLFLWKTSGEGGEGMTTERERKVSRPSSAKAS